MTECEYVQYLDAFADYDEVSNLITQCIALKETSDPMQTHSAELIFEKFIKLLDRYQEQPHLLDSHLKLMISRLFEPIYSFGNGGSSMAFHTACKFIYHISKVRGCKTIIRHLPHEVTDLDIAIDLLSKQSPDYRFWQTRYVLWMWLSLLFTLPFDFNKFDNSGNERLPLMERIMQLIRKYLVVGDSPRLAAAVACSRFLSRPEIRKIYLRPFIDWFLQARDEVFDNQALLNSRIGVFLALAYLYKHGKREELVEFSGIILKKIVDCDIFKQSKDYLVKILLKIGQRVGLSLLPIKVVSWRYSRGRRSIVDSLKNPQASSSIKEAEKILNEESEKEITVPSEIEDIITFLLDGLRYNSSAVRWSAAKGIGRITSRLPLSVAGDVVASVCDIINKQENDCAWHGGCLALAELARRGLILPLQLSQVVPRVIQASVYEESKGNFSVGDYVRDSACYVLWAFARAYDADDLRPYIDDITSSLLVVAVLDREIKCRRAASAAYQEVVGRIGNIPHGIEILTTVDNVAVGRTRRAFLELSKFVAQYNNHLFPLLNHLVDRKIDHWDCEIRELSGEALANIIELTPREIITNYVFPELLKKAENNDLNAKHGAIVALSKVLYSLKQTDYQVTPENLKRIENIVLDSNNWLKFKGIKGDLLRSASCQLIENISLSKINIKNCDNVYKSSIGLLRDCVFYSDPKIRKQASKAAKAFFEYYLSDAKEARKEWLAELFSNLTANQENIRCGALEALSYLPENMIDSEVSASVLFAIISSLNNSNDEENLWVSWKIAAIDCYTSIICKFGHELIALNIHMIRQTFRYNLTKGIEDYTTSSKGDIGEAVRIAAINSLMNLCLHLIKFKGVLSDEDQILTEEKVFEILSQILVHCVSHHDRMRGVAGEVFMKILPCFQQHFDLQQLTQVLPTLEQTQNIYWRDESSLGIWIEIFPLVNYSHHLWRGLVLSIGGIPSQTVKYACEATIRKLKSVKEKDQKLFEIIFDKFEQLFSGHLMTERLCLPLMNTFHMLIVSGLLNDANEEKIDKMLKDTWNLVRASSNPKKKMTSINIFCDSLRFKGLRLKCLTKLTFFLCTKYPVVRVFAAEALYTALMSYGDIVFEDDDDGTRQEEALRILTDCDWNKHLPIISPTRDKLRAVLGIN